MKQFPIITLVLLGLLSACNSPALDPDAAAAPTATEAFNAYLDSVFDAAVARSPEWESALGIRTHYHDWNDISDEQEAKELKIRQNELAVMRERFDPAQLDRTAQLSFRLFEEKVMRLTEAEKWRLYHYPVNQMHGVHAETISFLINSHRIDS
ncbi:MAG: DUF885 family protein, partial [Bacteroidota bacterium]